MMPIGVRHTRALYGLAETAHLCDVSQWWLRQRYYSGKIKGHKVAGRLKFPASEIDRLLTETKAPYEPATEGIGVISAQGRKERRDSKKPATSMTRMIVDQACECSRYKLVKQFS
jgi:hypothetical protein